MTTPSPQRIALRHLQASTTVNWNGGVAEFRGPPGAVRIRPNRWLQGEPLVDANPYLSEILRDAWREWSGANEGEEDPMSQAVGYGAPTLRSDPRPAPVSLSSRDWEELLEAQRVRGRVGFEDLRVVDAGAERRLDGLDVGFQTVGRDLRGAEDASAQLGGECVRGLRRALLDAVDGHELRPRVERDPGVLVAELRGVALDEMALLLADEGPHLVELQHVAVEVAHPLVEDAAAPLADAEEEVRDRGPRDPGHPFRGAQGGAFHEGRHHPHALAHGEHFHCRLPFSGGVPTVGLRDSAQASPCRLLPASPAGSSRG